MDVINSAVPAIAGGTPIRTEPLVFGRPLIGEEEIADVAAVLRSGWIGTGRRTFQFEAAFANYVAGQYAVAVSSCTAALHLALVALGIEPGDEVIVPSLSFVASANSVIHAGGTPILCDVDVHTQTVRSTDIEPLVGPRTRAIMPVHFAGRAADMTAIQAAAQRYRLAIVNDAAHAIETEHAGRKIPAFGTLTAYSFYPTKNLTTGEGGMLVTDDEQLADRLRMLRLHGLSADAWRRFSQNEFKHYEAVELGFKYNMTDLQAAIGLGQLARLESAAVRRQHIWARYLEAFSELPLDVPPDPPAGDRHAHHLFTILLRVDALSIDRDLFATALQADGIGIGIHYRAIHLQPYYRQRFGYRPGQLPNALEISERTLSLPLSASMSDRDVADVIEAVRRVATHFSR